MEKQHLFSKFQLQFFSVFISFITYGFALTNYSLTVDSESPAFADYSLGLGRWGTNLVRYRIFEGLLPYFTLLLGLFFLSLSAVELSKIFRLKGIYAYVFCALFLTLPQHAYQLAFTMQADAVPIGFFCSILGLSLFIKNIQNPKNLNSVLMLFIACLLITFTISIYQALIFIPVTGYVVYFFINIYNETFNLKKEFIKLCYFILFMIVAVILYYISVKIFCPPMEGGYLSSYTSGGESGNKFVNFYNLWVDNIRGDFFYGDKTFLFTSIAALLLLVTFFKEKGNALLKSLCLLIMLVIPFLISFPITNGSHPPRLYVSSSIIFGFLIVHLMRKVKEKNIQPVLLLVSLIVFANIYFITNLFYSNYKIFNHDLTIAKKMDNIIQNKYPDFNPNISYVYFYGALPESNHDKLKLPNSDVFGGSLFRWDGGNNWRIINFFRVNDVAYYKFLDDKDAYNKVKDSIPSMPKWPNPESIKKVDNVMIIKIGDTEGAKLPFQ